MHAGLGALSYKTQVFLCFPPYATLNLWQQLRARFQQYAPMGLFQGQIQRRKQEIQK